MKSHEVNSWGWWAKKARESTKIDSAILNSVVAANLAGRLKIPAKKFAIELLGGGTVIIPDASRLKYYRVTGPRSAMVSVVSLYTAGGNAVRDKYPTQWAMGSDVSGDRTTLGQDLALGTSEGLADVGRAAKVVGAYALSAGETGADAIGKAAKEASRYVPWIIGIALIGGVAFLAFSPVGRAIFRAK